MIFFKIYGILMMLTAAAIIVQAIVLWEKDALDKHASLILIILLSCLVILTAVVYLYIPSHP